MWRLSLCALLGRERERESTLAKAGPPGVLTAMHGVVWHVGGRYSRCRRARLPSAGRHVGMRVRWRRVSAPEAKLGIGREWPALIDHLPQAHSAVVALARRRRLLMLRAKLMPVDVNGLRPTHVPFLHLVHTLRLSRSAVIPASCFSQRCWSNLQLFASQVSISILIGVFGTLIWMQVLIFKIGKSLALV